MLHFLRTCGPTGFLLLILSIVVVALAVRGFIQLFARKDAIHPGTRQGVHAIIFWGAFSALLGILGQCTGIYNALGAIARASEISPAVIMAGLAESFTSTLFGLTIFIVSALLWFILHSRYRHLTEDGPAAG